jgi:hypothetical protein
VTEHDTPFDPQDGPRPAGDGRELHDAEARARRAFGLDATETTVRRRDDPSARQGSTDRLLADRQKRRFVHDGEVPVVVMGGIGSSSTNGASPTNRLAVAETALDSERVARRRAERALGEAQAAVHDLQTKIGHANLARDEATEKVGQLAAELQRLQELLESERVGRAEAEQALRAAIERKRPGAPAMKSRVGRPRRGEPKPVKWW